MPLLDAADAFESAIESDRTFTILDTNHLGLQKGGLKKTRVQVVTNKAQLPTSILTIETRHTA